MKDTNLSGEQLREAIAEVLRRSSYGHAATAPVNKLLALFKDRQTQLLTEMMGQKVEVMKFGRPGQKDGTAKQIEAVPIEVFNQYLKGLNK